MTESARYAELGADRHRSMAVDGQTLLADALREPVASLPYLPPTKLEDLGRQRNALPPLGTTARVTRTDVFPYPAALDDCVEVALWVVEHATELEVDTGCFGLMGASAGGGLAAGLALRTRDAGHTIPHFMVLNAPMLDDRLLTPSSRLDNLVIWSREANAFAWECYLGPHEGDGADVSGYAAPARADDLAGLPPTFLSVGAADGFRDEGIAFAGRLAQQGVPVDLRVYAGAPHGYGMFISWPTAVRASRDTLEWLAEQIGVGVVGGGGSEAMPFPGVEHL